VGGRLKPKNGLQTYFEPPRTSLKDTNSLTDKVGKRIPTAELIFAVLTADKGGNPTMVAAFNLTVTTVIIVLIPADAKLHQPDNRPPVYRQAHNQEPEAARYGDGCVGGVRPSVLLGLTPRDNL